MQSVVTMHTLIIILLAVSAMGSALPQRDMKPGSPCKTHRNTPGICRLSSECKWLEDSLRKKEMSHSDIVVCSFVGVEDVACCEEGNSAKPPQTNNPTSSRGPKGRADYACTKYTNALKLLDKVAGDSKPAGAGEFPHMAALYTTNVRASSSDPVFSCGGTIISDYFVLTAAHCLNGQNPIYVRVGELDIAKNYLPIENPDYYIEQSFIHPEYDGTHETNDIALLRVNRTFEFVETMWPACLNTDPNDFVSDQLIATGWGITSEQGRQSNILLKVNVTGMPLADCQDQLRTRFEKVGDRLLRLGISNQQMCAYDPEAINDVCKGDSGGPLQLPAEPDQLSRVIGVVSFGVACATKYPSVFTRVAAYINWIESIVDDWPNELPNRK